MLTITTVMSLNVATETATLRYRLRAAPLTVSSNFGTPVRLPDYNDIRLQDYLGGVLHQQGADKNLTGQPVRVLVPTKDTYTAGGGASETATRAAGGVEWQRHALHRL